MAEDEAKRLKALIHATTAELRELRASHDPDLRALVQETERTRAEAIARLAELNAER